MTPARLLACALVGLHVGVLGVVAVNRLTFRRTRPRPAPPADDRADGVRVSVLVPARNEEENLRRLLPSVLAQDLPDVELIVVDDASEDGTADVLAEFASSPENIAENPTGSRPRLVPVAGSGPPAGWIGKVHALYQATGHATGDLFVFLDADAAFEDPGALRRIVGRWLAHGGEGTALTGLPCYLDRGPGALLTSLVPFAVVSALPVPLVPRTRMPALSALNGQIWLLGAADYRRLTPHAAHPDEVLEDVVIGRYLKRQGVQLHFLDLRGEVSVRMYRSFAEAWAGFRKNAYLLAGGSPGRFATFFGVYSLVWVVPSAMPLLLPGPLGWLPLATLTVAKGAVDRWARFPLWVTALAPVAVGLGAALQLGSAVAHARGTVAWKGRAVGPSCGPAREA